MITSLFAKSWHAGLLSIALLTSFAVPPSIATLLQCRVEHAQEIPANVIPPTFEGRWSCHTVVVSSNLSAVNVGREVQSQVAFRRMESGTMVAQWDQPGWTETRTSASSAGPSDLTMERTNYYLRDGSDGHWAACSHDHFTRLDNNTLVSCSYVDQFLNGQYLGRYQTKSILYRMNEVAWSR